MPNINKILLVIVFVMLGIGVFLYIYGGDTGAPQTDDGIKQGSDVTSKESVEVTQTNITQGGVSKLPKGFPSSIPVESVNIKESFKVDYNDKGVTQYTVSYTSMRSRDALWTIYSDFMNKERYLIDADTSSRNLGQITGFLGNDSLSVVISTQDGRSLVQMNLLVRQ